MFEGINFLAVLAATLVSMVLGFLWYTPVLFGNIWMKEVGLKPEEMDPKISMRGHLVSLITTFIATWGLAVLVGRLGLTSWLSGLKIGVGVGAAFIALSFISNDVYERRSFKLSLINSGYRVVYFGLAGIILALWK